MAMSKAEMNVNFMGARKPLGILSIALVVISVVVVAIAMVVVQADDEEGEDECS